MNILLADGAWVLPTPEPMVKSALSQWLIRRLYCATMGQHRVTIGKLYWDMTESEKNLAMQKESQFRSRNKMCSIPIIQTSSTLPEFIVKAISDREVAF